MTYLIAGLLWLLAGGLGLMMLVQAARGTVDLLSVRNFFFVGFILFQVISPATTLWSEWYDNLKVSDQPRAAAIYFLLTVLFVGLFLLVYSRRKLVHAVAARFGSDAEAPGPTSLLILATAFLGLGLVTKFGLVYVPYVGPAADALGSGIIILTVGMAAWVAAPRLLNPAIVLPAAGIVLASTVAVLARGAFSRRDVVALVVALAWGAYHGHWKHLGFKAVLARATVLVFLGLLFFGAFTATRSAEKLINSPGELLERLTSGNPFAGLYEFGTGQFTGANSMWIIQTRPDAIPYDTLHTARYVISHPIPRQLWPEKPVGLGLTLPDQAHVRRVAKDLNLGPGIIGHIYNDNPWLAFLPYTIVLALVIRFFDELVRVRPWSPFIVLPIAVGLGEMVALPRGEAGLFFVRAVVYVAGAWVAMNVTAAGLRLIGLLPRREPATEWAVEGEGYEGEAQAEPGS